MHFLLLRKHIQPLLMFVQIADSRILCIYTSLININIQYNVFIKYTYFISEKSEHIYFGLDENWVFCLGKETKNIYKWWIVVPWTTLFYHHIPNKAMIWQIVFHIKKGMQRNGAWLRYAMRSFIQTKNGCHCPCNCLGWHTTITAATTMRQMGISLNECMIFCHFIMKFLK